MRMRPRGSVTGPLIIISIGVLFLIRAISPEFPILELVGRYWPYLLIVWGTVSLIEVAVRTLGHGTIPVTGVSGPAWFVVVLVCLIGLGAFQFHRPDAWWAHTNWGRGFDDAFGQEHTFAIASDTKTVGKTPVIVLEDFRGDAKIIGGEGETMTLSGHKSIRAMKDREAEQADLLTPVEIATEGKRVIIHCNQRRAGSRIAITTNLELTVPKGANVEATGSLGDFDISSLTGAVQISSGNAGVRVQDIGGNVIVETRRSDLVRCTNIGGSVELKGHGSDVELTKVSGPVTVSGDYNGTMSLRDLSKPVHVQNSRTEFQVERVLGEVRLERGSLNVQNVQGPMRLNAHSTDVTMEQFSDALDVSIDRGDVELKPGHVPLGKMAVRTGSGNIEFSVPVAAAFALAASTNSGSIENEFGDGLKEESSGKGARLNGKLGSGPDVNLATDRGNITVRKSEETPSSTPAARDAQDDDSAHPKQIAQLRAAVPR